jgi:hypothetical protein
MRTRIRAGDIVEVKAPGEILATLDADGALDHLPFMPEMIAYCGKRFQISKRVLNTCNSGPFPDMRGFNKNDVVLLDGLRCSGANHEGCQKGCMIFWREAWLRKVKRTDPSTVVDLNESGRLLARLRVLIRPNFYFCQASELLKATKKLSQRERVANCFGEVRAGNCSPLEMAGRIGTWLLWKLHRMVLGTYAKGNKVLTPTESLNLRPGERVVVKSMDNIIETLNRTARNRGLVFFPNMRLLCGRERRVERRLDKIIVDGTGEMRQLQNTVYLEGSHCGCPDIAFGGCSRHEFAYWREIWLRRPADLS